MNDLLLHIGVFMFYLGVLRYYISKYGFHPPNPRVNIKTFCDSQHMIGAYRRKKNIFNI